MEDACFNADGGLTRAAARLNKENARMKCIKEFIKFTYNTIRFFGVGAGANKKQLKKISTSAHVHIGRKARLELGEPCFLSRRGVDIAVRDNAVLKIGGHTFFNFNCIIACREAIEIGRGCMFGPNCMIYDHDHARTDGDTSFSGYVTAPVLIGDNVWCGGGVTILKGTQIGDNVIVGAGCVLKGIIPANTTVVQKRSNTFIRSGETIG